MKEEMSHKAQPSRCPACHSEETETLQSISTRELATLYRQSARIDVSHYLAGVEVINLQRCRECDLQFFDPPCPGDGVFSEQLQRFDWYYQEDKAEYGFARQFARRGCSLLEVGCGSGAFHSWLPQPLDYTGLEFNDEAVRKGRSRGLNVLKQPVSEHAEALPGKYDVVCAFQVLEHVTEPDDFCRACVNALAPNGILILTVPAEDSFLRIATNLYLNLPPHHALRWTDRALRNLAERQGLTVREIWHEPLAPYHQVLRSKALARQFLCNRLGRTPKLIELGLVNKLLNGVLRMRSFREACASRGLNSFNYGDVGHTVGLVACRTPAETTVRGQAL